MPINMKKGDAPVSMTKASKVRVSCSWSSKTDYDLYALVVYKDGRVETVSTFPAIGVPAREVTEDGAVRHGGDVGRGARGKAEEVIEVSLHDGILAVIPVAYSAQSNGTGSFRKYSVSMEVDGGNGEKVAVSAANASSNNLVYTCVPGMIVNAEDGVRVHALEEYSAMGSENRPLVQLAGGAPVVKKGLFGKSKAKSLVVDGVEIQMDKGPKNRYK